MSKTPPFFTQGIPFIHDLPKFMDDPLEFWINAGEVAPIVRVRLTSLREFWVVSDPELLQEILQKKPKLYVRDRRLMKIHRMGRPEYSFNTDDWEEWLWRRRLMQPAFHKKQLEKFRDVMVEEALQLTKEVADGDLFELGHAVKTLTMHIIGKTMFSYEFGEDIDMLQDAYEVWTDYLFERTSGAVDIPPWFPMPLNIKNQRMIKTRERILGDIIHHRHKTQEVKGDLLDMLIEAKLDDGRSFSAEQLIQELNGIVFAGHDTTAMTLTWIFYFLTQYPEIEAKLRDEIDTVLQGNLPTIDDLENLTYLEAVILETLRFYPPVYLTIREAMKDDQLGDYFIPKNTSVVVNIRGAHLNKDHWQHPRQFDPMRFLDERNENRHRYALIPFIGGPRKCMGDSFAMMEMQLVVATILQRSQFNFTGNDPVNAKSSFVIVPEKDIMMRASVQETVT